MKEWSTTEELQALLCDKEERGSCLMERTLRSLIEQGHIRKHDWTIVNNGCVGTPPRRYPTTLVIALVVKHRKTNPLCRQVFVCRNFLKLQSEIAKSPKTD